MEKLTGNPNQYDASFFSESLKGNCLCGSVHVTINDPELFTRRRGHICHCSNCRKVSGSYASINLLIEEDKVQIVDRDGTLREFIDKETLSGKAIGRWFCSRCGNPVKSMVKSRPGLVIVKMGIFPRIPAPEFETFALHRHEWQGKHDDVVQYKIRPWEETL